MKNIRRILTGLAAVAALGIVTSSPAQAQAAPDDGAVRTLREMVAQPSADMRNRKIVEDFLARDDVRDMARSHGMDPERIDARAAALDSETAGDLATRIQTLQDEGALAGGDTFVITSTTVIIVLLLIILIVVS